MNWIRKICYQIIALCSRRIVLLAPLAALVGMIICKPWEKESLYNLCTESYYWECVAIGPIPAMLLLLSGYMDNVKTDTFILHIGGRKRLFLNLLAMNLIFSMVISLWLNLILFFVGNGMFHTVPGDPIEHITPVMFRTSIALWLLLNILGLIYLIVQWLTFPMAGVAAVLLIAGMEAAGKFYFQRQLFWKYAFPPDTVLYLSPDGFGRGMLWLFAYTIVLLCILLAVLQKKDFLARHVEQYE